MDTIKKWDTLAACAWDIDLRAKYSICDSMKGKKHTVWREAQATVQERPQTQRPRGWRLVLCSSLVA